MFFFKPHILQNLRSQVMLNIEITLNSLTCTSIFAIKFIYVHVHLSFYGYLFNIQVCAFNNLFQSIEALEAEMLNGQKLQGPPTAYEVNYMLKNKKMEERYFNVLFSTLKWDFFV